MKKFIYIITDKDHHNLHMGLCADLVKTIEFYEQMPTLFFDASQMLNKLVYFEEIDGEDVAFEKYKSMSTFTRSRKEELIASINPNMVDIRKRLTHQQK